MSDQMQLSFTIFRPAAQVFEAIVRREHLRRYFASDPDSDLITGKTVNWGFEDVGRVIPVQVLQVEANSIIEFSWEPIGWRTTVKMNIEQRDDHTSVLKIEEAPFNVPRDGVPKILEQTHGWTDFACCLKAYLYAGVNLRTGEMI